MFDNFKEKWSAAKDDPEAGVVWGWDDTSRSPMTGILLAVSPRHWGLGVEVETDPYWRGRSLYAIVTFGPFSLTLTREDVD